MTAVVLVVGDEVLSGHTRDTNSGLIAQRMTALGYSLRRVVVVPDEPDEIARELKALLKLKPVYVFVSGGLGPTPDDRTVEGICAAVGKKPVFSEAFFSTLLSNYSARGISQEPVALRADPGAVKMATAPEGALPMRNEVGAAPGIELKTGGTTVFCLPGVPWELAWILENEIIPARVERKASVPVSMEVRVKVRERMMRQVQEDFVCSHKHIKFGSYPGEDGVVVLRLTGERSAVERGVRDIRAALVLEFGEDVLK